MAAAWTNGNEEPVRAMSFHETSIYERPTLPEAFRARTSIFERVGSWLGSIGPMIAMAMRPPRLTDYLPPIPARCTVELTSDSVVDTDSNKRAERMLLEMMSFPPEYLDAAILIVRATRALRKRGNDVFAEGVVVFALSRMSLDADGTISIKRLREYVHDIPAIKSVVPVLLRLEEQGVVALEAPLEQVPISGMIDMDRMRVRLLVVP